MKLAILFEIPDGQAEDYAAMVRQLIDHHRFAAANDLPVWSFDTHMRPIAASMDEDGTVAITELAFALVDGRVAAAGKSWDTHMAKFDGTVLPR